MSEENQLTTGDRSDAAGKARVYDMSPNGEWVDIGTGDFSCETTADGSLILVVKDNEREIFRHIVDSSLDYHKSDTIITVGQPERRDMALSFGNIEESVQVWQQIAAVQRKSDVDLLSSDESIAYNGHLDSYFPLTAVNFPTSVDFNNLNEVVESLQDLAPTTKESVAKIILTNSKFIPRLLELFEQAEDLENYEQLPVFFEIFRGIISLNDTQLLEDITAPEHFRKILGPLEYDPDLPRTQLRRTHRDFIAKAKFKQIVPLTGDNIQQRIHQNYNAAYLKDVALLRHLDDQTLTSLTQMVYFNNMSIVTHLNSDREFMQALFNKLRSVKDPKTKDKFHGSVAEQQDQLRKYNRTRIESFQFVRELCSLAKTLQVTTRDAFFRMLSQYGVFRIFQEALAHPKQQQWLWLICADVLTSVLISEAKEFIAFLASNMNDENGLMGMIIKAISSPKTNRGLGHQLVEVVKAVIDPDCVPPVDRESFLGGLYRHHMKHLADALNIVSPNDPYAEPMSPKFLALEVLHVCVQKHKARIKAFIQGQKVFARLRGTLHVYSRDVVLSALRLISVCVLWRHDSSFVRGLIHHRVFEDVFKLFKENGARYNLLNSVVIQLVETIRKHNIKPLIEHIVTEYESMFSDVHYVETFQLLLLRHEQNKAPTAASWETSSVSSSRAQAEENEKSQYEYFNGSESDEEEAVDVSAALGVDESTFRRRKQEDEDEPDLLATIQQRSSQGTAGPKPHNSKKKDGQPRMKLVLPKPSNAAAAGGGSAKNSPPAAIRVKLSPKTESKLKLVAYGDDDDDDDDDDEAANNNNSDRKRGHEDLKPKVGEKSPESEAKRAKR